MLILERKLNEKVFITHKKERIEIMVTHLGKNRVCLGFKGSKEYLISRQELCEDKESGK